MNKVTLQALKNVLEWCDRQVIDAAVPQAIVEDAATVMEWMEAVEGEGAREFPDEFDWREEFYAKYPEIFKFGKIFENYNITDELEAFIERTRKDAEQTALETVA